MLTGTPTMRTMRTTRLHTIGLAVIAAAVCMAGLGDTALADKKGKGKKAQQAKAILEARGVQSDNGTVRRYKGDDRNGDNVHDHFDHHLKNPGNALKHNASKHHDHQSKHSHHYTGGSRDRDHGRDAHGSRGEHGSHSTVRRYKGDDRNGDGVHDHFDHHLKNPGNALKHNASKHHPHQSAHDRYRSHSSRYGSHHGGHYRHYDHNRSRFSWGITVGRTYGSTHGRCSHGYTLSSCHICNPHYSANRARVYVRPEPVVIERRTTVIEQPRVVVTPAPQPAPAVQYVNGWQLLRAKDPAGALKAFEDAIARDPDAGIHRIGCAIAGALLGDDDKAVAAMRDVVRFAPGSMIEAPVDGEIVGYYAALIDRYQTREDTELARVDDAFMVAAVSYLKRDFALAHAAVRNAQRLGDTDATVGQLGNMIDYQRQYQRKL